MKGVYSIICLVLLITTSLSAQTPQCTKLMEYVIENGTKKEEINAFQLIGSEWLRDVTAYTINDIIVVIAEIKQDDFGNSKKYIFCNIPSQNWENFYWGLNDYGKTYGERFHKYIFDYKCNCN